MMIAMKQCVMAAVITLNMCGFGKTECRFAVTPEPAGVRFCSDDKIPGVRLLSDKCAVVVNGVDAPVRLCRVSGMPFNWPWPGHQRSLVQTETASYLQVEASGEISVSVDPRRPFKRAVVRPLSAGIKLSRTNQAVSFKVRKHGYYSIEFDDEHEALHLFVDRTEEYAEKSAATKSYGPGMHVVGEVELQDGDRVYIDRDAIVYGAFKGVGVRDVRIYGHGVIDSSVCERVFAGAYSKLQTSCLRFHQCSDIVIDGPTVLNSPIWSVAFFDCDNVIVRHLKVVGQWRYNTDGIDICNSRNVVIEDSFIRSFDDAISIKGVLPYSDKSVENVQIRRCVLWCDWGRTCEPGIETWAPVFRGVQFEDCDLIHNMDGALNVLAGGPAIVEDVVYRNINVELQGNRLRGQLQKADDELYERMPCRTPWIVFVENKKMIPNSNDKLGHVRNVRVENVRVIDEGCVDKPDIWVHSEGKEFENIVISNVTVNGVQIR